MLLSIISFFITYWILSVCVILFILIRDWKETKEDLTTSLGLVIIGPLLMGPYFIWEIIIEPIFDHTIWIKKTKERIESNVVNTLPVQCARCGFFIE